MKPFRSQQLRDFARDAPKCFHCDAINDGTVVGAHSNRLEDGKGLGIKSHDLVAYVCKGCHDNIDGRAGHFTPWRDTLCFCGATSTPSSGSYKQVD